MPAKNALKVRRGRSCDATALIKYARSRTALTSDAARDWHASKSAWGVQSSPTIFLKHHQIWQKVPEAPVVVVLFYVRGGLASFVVASPFGSRCPGRSVARSIVIPRDRFWASYYLYAVADRRRMENRRGRSHRWTARSLVRSLGGISDDFAVVDWQGRAGRRSKMVDWRFGSYNLGPAL